APDAAVPHHPQPLGRAPAGETKNCLAMRLRAKHYATGQPVELVVADGRIGSVGPPTGAPADLTAGWVAPSFFDIQVNGCHGISFGSERLTADEVRRVADVCRSHGTTAFCPTL